jgi:hypothetical protein
MPVRVKVTAYSGYRGEECPVTFVLTGKRVEVAAILSTWLEEDILNRLRKRFFDIKGSDGRRYKIYYDEKTKEWFLETQDR